jgi:hypothetical protein
MNTTGPPPSAMEALECQFQTHLRLVRQNPTSIRNQDTQQKDEFQKAPLFSSAVARKMGHLPSSQYGLLGEEINTPSVQPSEDHAYDTADSLVYANHSEPWSAFICGLQGMGKSHSLATMLENCLFESHQYGKAPNPLTAMAFHFDPYSSTYSTQHCELAYFCNAGIDVRVLVSPRNLKPMKTHYENLSGLPADAKRPRVFPLKFSEMQLNNASIKALMSFGGSTSQPLYMSVLNELLEKLSEKRQGVPGIDFEELKRQLRAQKFNADQKAMLNLRMQLLESFMASGKEVKSAEAIWNFEPSSLTIVDLSSESVNEAAACGLYSICLGLFMADRNKTGRVVVLDEAHKVGLSTLPILGCLLISVSSSLLQLQKLTPLPKTSSG